MMEIYAFKLFMKAKKQPTKEPEPRSLGRECPKRTKKKDSRPLAKTFRA